MRPREDDEPPALDGDNPLGFDEPHEQDEPGYKSTSHMLAAARRQDGTGLRSVRRPRPAP